MSHQLSKDKLLANIIEGVCQEFPSGQHESLKVFVNQFYESQPFEFLKKKTLQSHIHTLTGLWNFFQVRPYGTPKINVYYWSPETAGDISERIIVDVINDDMSFLVDSLTSLLTRLGVTPRVLLHPILRVRRDRQGQFISFIDRNTDAADARDESFIQCEIVDAVTPEMVETIRDELPQIFAEVALANRDWQAISERVSVAIEDLECTKKHGANGHITEIEDFLQWMRKDHFTFLGYCQYELVDEEGRLLRQPCATEALGILKQPDSQDLKNLFEGIDYDTTTRRLMMRPIPFLINKASQVSKVHRPVLMDAIGIKKFNKDGKPVGIHLFLGLFTSGAYNSSARDIPYLRQKIFTVLQEAGLSPNWHNGKALIQVLDSLPRDELFQATVHELKIIGKKVLELQQLRRLSLFVRQDSFKRFLSCLVYIPEDRFNSDLVDRMSSILEQEFKGEMSSVKAQFGSLALARVHYLIRVPGGIEEEYDIPAIEAKLVEASRSWRDDLRLALNEHYSEWKSARLFKLYRSAFPHGYQERYDSKDVIQDIEMCERAYASNQLEARVYQTPSENNTSFKLKIFNPHNPLALSDILPTLENLDVHVLSEMPFMVSPLSMEFPVWIQEFELASRIHCPVDIHERGKMFVETLHEVQQKRIENDGFNRLVLRAGLTTREAELIRAYFRYLKQLNIPFTETTIQNVLIGNPLLTKKVVELFQARFHPRQDMDTEKIHQELQGMMDNIETTDEDRILRRYANLVLSTVRTNFFQTTREGQARPCISFKFDCTLLDELPLPRPLYEIFVYSSRVEAIHLRGGKVARGGIRWSDRIDDFRTEILGLMKAQMVKNVVIVPMGSKGGFIVKSKLPPHSSRDELMAEAIECYQTMMRGMLDITDNLVENTVIPPDNTVRYDGDDPYLVVAADKGTASFSDYANGISAEYGFWLDDAFASGGSAGYDHKKMGITARGAWESVKQHFRARDINVEQDPIRVVGIGDMSGDVFGNGMLLSRKLKLVGAFNHQHIFLDPDPEAEKSFAERERLFKLPRSSWKDYNPEALSTGGGIYDRSVKNISLSPQVAQMLGIQKKTLTPNEIIRALLTLDVDLLWFGGIGTFIKSSFESHADAGDRANDAIRVNGNDLRCAVISEGANLGVTHLGRIEYSRKLKGRINTDAIDNSAGVDTSDHEVNIKILLRQIMDLQQITREERDLLLQEMTPLVAKLVLRDNYLQNLCINLVEWEGAAHLDSDIRLIRALEKAGKLNRSLEFLPDDARLSEYQSLQQGLSRPEIAVLMAYAKINLYEEILKTDLPDEPWLEDTLMQYFPSTLRLKYPAAILQHPLRREIVATCIVNQMINRTGSSFIYDLQDSTGASVKEVMHSFLIVVHVYSFEKLWTDIEAYDFRLQQDDQIRLYNDLLTILKRTVTWCLQNKRRYGNLNMLAGKLSEGMDCFIRDLYECLDEQAEERLANIIGSYLELNIEQEFAERLAILTIAADSPDILLIADQTGLTIKEVARLYFMVGSRFHISHLKNELHQMVQTTHWGRLALNGIQEDLYNHHNQLVSTIVETAQLQLGPEISQHDLFLEWVASHHKAIEKYDMLLTEAFSTSMRELATYGTLVRELKKVISFKDDEVAEAV